MACMHTCGMLYRFWFIVKRQSSCLFSHVETSRHWIRTYWSTWVLGFKQEPLAGFGNLGHRVDVRAKFGKSPQKIPSMLFFFSLSKFGNQFQGSSLDNITIKRRRALQVEPERWKCTATSQVPRLDDPIISFSIGIDPSTGPGIEDLKAACISFPPSSTGLLISYNIS